jgi:hypothetical protein
LPITFGSLAKVAAYEAQNCRTNTNVKEKHYTLTKPSPPPFRQTAVPVAQLTKSS